MAALGAAGRLTDRLRRRAAARLRTESGEGVAVERGLGAQRDRESQMRAGLVAPAEALEALAEREVRVMGRRVDLEERLERHAGTLVTAGVVVGPTERLEDRGLAGLQAGGPLEDDRGLGMVAALEQLVAALEQLVGALVVVGGSVRADRVRARVDGGTERARCRRPA